MERYVRILSVLLAVQVGVVGIVWYVAQGGGEEAADRLIAVDRATITALEITDGAETTADADKSIRIEKTDAGWRLPSVEGLPADAEKVTGLIDKLEDAQAAWPVATSDTSALRFEVTEEKFQRRIRLFGGDTAAAELYLGTSPGMRKVHARRADSSDVYAITFAIFEVPTKAEEWLDKKLLQPKGVLESVERVRGWSLVKAGDAWQLSELAEGESTDGDAARDLISKVNDLRILGRAQTAPAEGDAPLFELKLVGADGTTVLRFFRPDAEADFVVGSDGYPGYFRVAGYIGEALDVDRAGLLGKSEVKPAAAATE